ncbi:MAG: hypothetical protein HND47_10260 [Chloroflexi bacterium]|nr:hypothetical protein [Chloroflexota bacterium]
MRHPLEFIPLNLRKPFFYIFLALTLLTFGVFGVLDRPLRTSAAPNGIVSFELARTADASQTMLGSWDENARLFAAYGLGFDYLFMPVYALALALGLLLAGYEKPKAYHTLTAWMGWTPFAASGFDAVENYALWQILIGNPSAALPQAAAFCATVKFVLLTAGTVLAVAGWVIPRASK